MDLARCRFGRSLCCLSVAAAVWVKRGESGSPWQGALLPRLASTAAGVNSQHQILLRSLHTRVLDREGTWFHACRVMYYNLAQILLGRGVVAAKHMGCAVWHLHPATNSRVAPPAGAAGVGLELPRHAGHSL